MAEARTPETGRMNARVLSSLSLILFLFVLIYFTTFRELVTLWSTDDDYGHGFPSSPCASIFSGRRDMRFPAV